MSLYHSAPTNYPNCLYNLFNSQHDFMGKTIVQIGKIPEEGNMGFLEWMSLLNSHYSKSDWPSFPRQMPRLMRQYCKHNEQLPTQLWERRHGLRTLIEVFFSLKSQTFGLEQTIWADKFWGIWGIFGWFISSCFDVVSPLSLFSNYQPLILLKTKLLYPNSKYSFGIWIWIWVAKN